MMMMMTWRMMIAHDDHTCGAHDDLTFSTETENAANAGTVSAAGEDASANATDNSNDQ